MPNPPKQNPPQPPIYPNINAYNITRHQGDTPVVLPQDGYFFNLAQLSPPILPNSTVLAAFLAVRWFGTHVDSHVDVANGQATVTLGEYGSTVTLLDNCHVPLHLSGPSIEIQFNGDYQQDDQYMSRNGIAVHIEGVVLYYWPDRDGFAPAFSTGFYLGGIIRSADECWPSAGMGDPANGFLEEAAIQGTLRQTTFTSSKNTLNGRPSPQATSATESISAVSNSASRGEVDRWILPNIGDKPLAEVSNGALKELIATMQDGGLAPETIVNYSQVVKMVVASAVDKDGDQIYPREWNHDFCELPIVQKEQQYRPTITEAELRQVLASSN